MKVLILILSLFMLSHADEENAKLVLDLTTGDLQAFERKVIKGIVAHKTHYEGDLRELEVTAVIHGGAYRFFVKEPAKTIYRNDANLTKAYPELRKRIASLVKTYDVEFLMCKAGMKSRELKENEIVDFVTLVPNSTIGLIDKQNEGYAYVPVSD